MALPYIIVNGRLTEDPVVKEVNGETVLNYTITACVAYFRMPLH